MLVHWIFCLKFVEFGVCFFFLFNYSCRQLFARALNPRGKSLEIYMKKAGILSYLPIEQTHTQWQIVRMRKAYPVLTSEISVQEPPTVCMHLQSSDSSQVINAHFSFLQLTVLSKPSARVELADFCYSKFPFRYKLLVSPVHSAVYFGTSAKNPENTWYKFLFSLKLNQALNLCIKCLKLLELLPLMIGGSWTTSFIFKEGGNKLTNTF